VRQIRLQPTTIQNVVNYTVIVEVENRDDLLLPGMTATVDFVIEQRTDVLLVANAALRLQPTQEMVVALRENMQERLKKADASPNPRAPQPVAWSSRSTKESDMARLWVLDEQGNLGVVPVRKGSTDGIVTEIAGVSSSKGGTQEGMGAFAMPGGCVPLREGTQVISAVTQQKTQSASTNGKSLLPPPGPGGRRF
jgi:HlyD family secretion protein